MNPGRFYLPNVGANIGPMMRASYLPVRGNIGFFSKIANSFRTFNWSGLLNGANKTLNVVNQTIPLVRQAGPMLNNMKSMLRIAKAFGSETTRSNSNNKRNNNKLTNRNTNDFDKKQDFVLNDKKDAEKKEIRNDNYPNFFV